MPAPSQILELVERFGNNREAYRSGQYNETRLRREFIDPFFIALGWDVNNERGYAEAYKDVIHEDAICVGGATKAPDYCFQIGGARKFFLEAKRPAVNIRDDLPPAFQVRRYAWSAKLPLSILTDFEEFAVYDCRIRPSKTDKASAARILYLTCPEYPARWDELAAIFAREAVLKGSFDRFVESKKVKKGTAEVDAAFLAEIESWRDLLARQLALRNPNLTPRELNFAVQRTIDRIIFLRICEDRRIEPYGQLMALLNGDGVYPRLCVLFRRADERYNSGLFHFHFEKERAEAPDTLTLGLSIDDDALKGIIRNLYYPESPYEFSVLPADILGQVYEQFLGKVIRLTAGHRAVVEDKPEVKKAGGVYYTPTYIVDYIVRNTVGRLLEGSGFGVRGSGAEKAQEPGRTAALTPKAASRLRILDPACGSGSFLIGAYQYLLDWHREQYLADGPEKWATGRNPRLFQAAGGDWRLTTGERKRLLLNNLYGVDIDPQAVEVTKLSLLLKVLEGESEETLGQQLRLFHERALPDLGNNIKCGNSLIGTDFYRDKQMSLLPEEDRYRINVFDWQSEFPAIFTAEDAGDAEGRRGFDAIIGNPPYIRIQTMKEWAPVEVEHYKTAYKSASKGNYDIYVVFVERGLSLLNGRGRLGFILPHKFFNAQYGEPLRDLLAKGRHLAHVVHFGDQQVFAGATTYTCLMFLDKAGGQECKFLKIKDLNAWRATSQAEEAPIQTANLTASEWNFAVGKGAGLFKRLSEFPLELGDLAERIFQGLKTGADPVFIVEVRGNRFFSPALDREVQLEPAYLRPLFKSGQMKRYFLAPAERVVIFPYVDGQLEEWAGLSKQAPATAEYLRECKSILDDRERGRWTGPRWYCYSRTQALEVISSAKILTADINKAASYCLDSSGHACFPGGAAGGYGIVLPSDKLPYLLGLLNSSVVDYYLKQITTNFHGGWFGYDSRFLRQLPIRPINFANRADKARHDRMVELVNAMLLLHKHLAAAKTDHEQTSLQRQIDATDRQIDLLVYELYGLTDAEIKIVEESTAR